MTGKKAARGQNILISQGFVLPNQEFEGLDPADLLNLSNWVHHHPVILPQGRCTYFSTSASSEEDEEEGDDEDIEEGPKLLTEASADNS